MAALADAVRAGFGLHDRQLKVYEIAAERTLSSQSIRQCIGDAPSTASRSFGVYASPPIGGGIIEGFRMSTLLLLPGDGIGPEVIEEVKRVSSRLCNDLVLEERDWGGASFRYSWHTLDGRGRGEGAGLGRGVDGRGRRTEMGECAPRPSSGSGPILRLRAAMEVYANLRPAVCFDALSDASALKQEVVAGLDIMIVRELTGGVYFGTPRVHRDPGRRPAARRRHPGLYHSRDRARLAAPPSNWRAAAGTR